MVNPTMLTIDVLLPGLRALPVRRDDLHGSVFVEDASAPEPSA